MDKLKRFLKNNIFVLSILMLFFTSSFSLVFFDFSDKSSFASQEITLYEQKINALAKQLDKQCQFTNIDFTQDEVVNIYNFVTPVRFSGEDDSLDSTLTTFDKTTMEVLEEMYNSETNYSVKKYYQVVSNGKLNLETVFLLDENTSGSVQVSYTRAQCGNKNNNGGVGYDPNASEQYLIKYHLLDEICGNAIGQIREDYNLTCDVDNNGTIDSFSIILLPQPTGSNVVVKWSDLLWAHSADISGLGSSATSLGLSIDNFQYQNSLGKKITFGNYAMQDLSTDYNTITGMAVNNTAIHELGHVLGFPDYYIYDDDDEDESRSVSVWDVMSYNHLDLPQYPLSYNRYKQNWITDSNIKQITANGVYTLKPVNLEETTGKPLNNRTIAYKICSDEYPNQAIWIEYRKQTDGSFENNGRYCKDGLIVYRVDEGFKAASGRSGMVTAGNFNAKPFSIYVFRNTITNIQSNSLAFVNSFYAPLNMDNKSMGDEKTYSTPFVAANGSATNSVNMLATDITWQVYSGTNAQDTYSDDEVTEVDSGIVLTVISMDETTGELQFSVQWDEFVVNKSDFTDSTLYNKLLAIAGKQVGDTLGRYDLAGVTQLDLYNSDISSLAGLSNMSLSNITSIDLSLNSLDDFSQLVSLHTLYPNIKFNLSFNNFDLTNLPESLKTSNFVWGYQKVNNLTNRMIFLEKNDTTSLGYFYKTENQDVYFDITESGLKTINFVPGEYSIFMKNSTSVFTHQVEYQIKIARVYLSNENGTLERNDTFPYVIIEGMSKDLFDIVQTPATFATDDVTDGLVQVDWVVSLKSDPTKKYQFSTMYFEVVDTQKPTITLLGDTQIEISYGTTLTLPNPEVSIVDNGVVENFDFIKDPVSSNKGYWTKEYYKVENNIEQKISQIDTTVYGKYIIKYYAVDNYGNKSDVVSRQVEVMPLPIQKSQFTDPNLYDAICELTGKKNVYQNSLSDYSLVNLRNKNISSLGGLDLLTFKENVKLDFAQNKLSSFDEISTLLGFRTNISLICLHFNNFDISGYEDFAYKQKTTFGIQGIDFLPYYIKNGNVGENLQFVAFDKDSNFRYTSYSPANGLNTIQTFGEYDLKIDFYGVFDEIQNKFRFGNIDFSSTQQQQLEVFESYDCNLVVNGFDKSVFVFKYFVNDVLTDESALAINQTVGEKNLKIQILYNNVILKTIEKHYIVEDTQAPVASFENGLTVEYLKLGQSPNLNVLKTDNYDSSENLVLQTLSNTFESNTTGEFVYCVYVEDSSGNTSNILQKTIYVGNVSLVANPVVEYNTSLNLQSLFEFDFYTFEQFDSVINTNINSKTLGQQTFSVSFVHTSGLQFDFITTVLVKDLQAPEIWLEGGDVELYVGTSYRDEGCRAYDDYDGDVTSRIVIDGYVDVNVVGRYVISYQVTDSSGNQSVKLVRTVKVLYLPFEEINIKLLNQKDSFELEEKLVFELDFDNVDQSKYNINSEFSWYVDGQLYKTSNTRTITLSFDKAGKHNVCVVVTNTLMSGGTSTVQSDNVIVTINKTSLLENYGMYFVAGISGIIVVAVIVSLIIKRKRRLY